LAIVKSVVEAHGGAIDVDSNERDGTRFTITLPRSSGEVPLALPSLGRSPASSSTLDRPYGHRFSAGAEREAA